MEAAATASETLQFSLKHSDFALGWKSPEENLHSLLWDILYSRDVLRFMKSTLPKQYQA